MHRFTNKKGIELIKYFEGFSNKVYLCPAKYRTIGYGHKLGKYEIFYKMNKITAERVLREDLFAAERAVMRYINLGINDDQFAALVSFTFNLGAAALQRSALRQKINYGSIEEAAEEFHRWIYARGHKVKGLIKRRSAESKLFSGFN